MRYLDELGEERMAEALGRPIKRCPSCGQIGAAHYIPDHLDDTGLMQAGQFTCETAPDPRGDDLALDLPENP